MVGIIDYNAGNIKSVERALTAINAPYILSKSPKELEHVDKIIFPGVGEASYAMDQLKMTGFDIFLKDWAAAKKPIMGICLGSQIIFEHSEEGNVDCLGLVKGEIKHFTSVWSDDIRLKVPHMGWNNLKYENGACKLFEGIDDGKDFYFVHSYLIQPADWSIVKASADYGCKVPACIQSGSITAFQFHPEKSGEHGLQILRNFAFNNQE